MALSIVMNYLSRYYLLRIKPIVLLKFLVVFVTLCGCKRQDQIEKEIAKVPVAIVIDRFDATFATLTEENITEIKGKYPFLFSEKYADSIWINKAKDTIQLALNKEVKKAFSDLEEEKQQLHDLFQHIKFYFPEIKEPKVVTITSDVDYHNKVVIAKDLLIISLDTYLGTEHHFYEGIQKYIKKNFKREQIIPDVASAYAKNLVGPIRERTFLGNIISFGKELYLRDLFLPEMDNPQKIGQIQEDYLWLEANEEQIWRYFVDKQLLYSTDNDLLPRFLFPAPFSKFYLEEIDKEAPDRVAQYIGWKIVESYMKNNNVSLRQLLMADAETIFNKSKYKPSR